MVAGQKAQNFTQKGLHNICSLLNFLVKAFHKSVFTENFWATASDFCQRCGNSSLGVIQR